MSYTSVYHCDAPKCRITINVDELWNSKWQRVRISCLYDGKDVRTVDICSTACLADWAKEQERLMQNG